MYLDIRELLQRIAPTPGCLVRPCVSRPDLEGFEQREGLALPPDLKEFFSLCDGVELRTDGLWEVEIHGFGEFRRANPVLVGGNYEDDRTWDWFLIGNLGNAEYLTIDLNPRRIGRCYDSGMGYHGIVGSCPIIATSFTDLLKRAYDTRGERPWWLQKAFISLGDAYDDE